MTAIGFWLALAGLGVGQDGFGTTRVAVVDVPAVSERYEKTAHLEAQFNRRRDKFNEQRDAKKEEIKRLGRALQEQFKPGTAEFDERRKQLLMLQTELDWFNESGSKKIERNLAESLHQIYLDIQDTVREIAEERGVDVVLAADRLPPDKPQTTGQARQQIVLQKVVYWNPRVDLTESVITRLNERYRAKQLASPGGKPTRAPPK